MIQVQGKRSEHHSINHESRPYQSRIPSQKRPSSISDYYANSKGLCQSDKQQSENGVTFMTQTPNREEVSMLSNYPIREVNIKQLRSINIQNRISNYSTARKSMKTNLRSQTPNLLFKKRNSQMTKSEIKSDLRHIPADSIPYLEHSDARCSHTPKVPSQIKVRNAYATRSIESKMPIKQFKKVAFVSEKSSLPDRSRSRQDTRKTLPSESTIEPLFSGEGKNHMSESAVGQKTQMQGSQSNVCQFRSNKTQGSKDQMQAYSSINPHFKQKLKLNKEDLKNLQCIVAQYQGYKNIKPQ